LAKAWSNSPRRATGAGYGIRISISDRDRSFDPDWATIDVDLGALGRVTVSLSDSFWRTCSELRSADIGRWLIGQGLVPWPKSAPPSLELTHLSDNTFKLTVPA
jgi:hypothetical protein